MSEGAGGLQKVSADACVQSPTEDVYKVASKFYLVELFIKSERKEMSGFTTTKVGNVDW